MKIKSIENKKIKKGIYILPNFFTLMNLFFGFCSVIFSVEGNFTTAAVAILLAGVFDLLDGKIARATHTTSRFGAEFDSLADLISFGMAPGVMMYLWVLQPLGRLGWLAAFLFTACGALRLARFNTNLDQTGDTNFTGLPIPAAAGMISVTLLFILDLQLNPESWRFPVLFLTYVLSFLMVSNIRYYSFKKIDLFKSMNFNVLVAMMLVLILIASKPAITLYVIALGYIASGPARYFLWSFQRNHQKEDLISADKFKD